MELNDDVVRALVRHLEGYLTDTFETGSKAEALALRDAIKNAGLPQVKQIIAGKEVYIPLVKMQEIRDLLKQDKRIHAIKLVREVTGCDLRDAKDFVEGLL